MNHKNRINGHFSESSLEQNSSEGHDPKFDLDKEPHDELAGLVIHQLTPAQAARLPVHETAALFSINEDDVTRLTDSIEQLGQQNPIVIHDGKVLDGRLRIKSGIRLNIPVLAVRVSQADLAGLSPEQWILHRNRTATDGRRMSDVEFALIVAAVYGDDAIQQALLRKKGGVPVDDTSRGQAHEHLSRVFTLSANLMKQALKLSKSGDTELIDMVKHKQLSFSKAEQILKLPQAQRKAAMNNLEAPLPLTCPSQAFNVFKVAVKSLEKTEKRLQEIAGSELFVASTRTGIQRSLAKLRDVISGLQKTGAADGGP